MMLVKVNADGTETPVYGDSIAVDDTGQTVAFDETTHKFQLQGGHYVHFTKLTDGNYKVPMLIVQVRHMLIIK